MNHDSSADITIDELVGQLDKLAQFIVEHVPGEPSQSEGVVDTAIRLLSRLTALEGALERYGKHDEYDCEAECQRRSAHRKAFEPEKPCTCGLDDALAGKEET